MKIHSILKRKKFLTAICCILLLIIIGAIIIFLLPKNYKSKGNTKDNLSNVSSYPVIISYRSGDNNLNLANENKSDKFFYIKDNNIWAENLSTGTSEQLTNYPKNKNYSPSYDENGAQIPSRSIRNIHFINDETVGFDICEVVSGDFGCSINVLNLKSKSITQKAKLDKNSSIIDLGFSDQNKFAFIYVRSGNEWVFALNENGQGKELFKLNFEGYGRGGFYYDSQKIDFSEDGNFVLQIATSSPISMFDFNTYLYDLKNDKKIIIPNSTQPSWLNDTQIIYTGFDSKLNIGLGLYIYDTVLEESHKITDVSDNAGFPNVLKDNRIIYKDKGDIWLYDFNTKESRKLLASATVFSVINDVKFSYVEVIPCNGKEYCGGLMGDYEYGKEKVFDIQKMESMDLNI